MFYRRAEGEAVLQAELTTQLPARAAPQSITYLVDLFESVAFNDIDEDDR
jgi:hypothetical protein